MNVARATGIALLAIAGGGCVETSVTRTSADTAIVRASAAPICQSAGAARVAERQAALETLKAGYDRYMIVGATADSNIRTFQGAGTYHTTGRVSGGYLSATTTYSPGPTFVSGEHNAAFAIRMFRDGEPGAARALSAREVLGPKWQEELKRGQLTTC